MVSTAGQVDRPARRVTSWLQRRPAIEALSSRLGERSGPQPWSSMFWPVAVVSLGVVLITGFFLMFFYDPSIEPVTYDGGYAPLHGAEMSRALESTLAITFDVRGGLLMRQLHNWSASLMIAALLVHILQLFFTGGFRGPRKLPWVLLFVLLFASMGGGLTGVVLPDDLASATSLAVLDGVMKAVPVVGAWMSFLVFRGEGTSGAIASLYPLHIVLLPLAMAGIVALLLLLVTRRASATPAVPGPERAGVTLAGALRRRAGLLASVVGVLVLVAATVTINPVWDYGPADPGNASAGVGAVWYLAFLDGAQRLVPSGWEFVLFDRTWTLAILVPVAVCGLYFAAAVLYPFLEGWIMGRRDPQIIPDRPRNVPPRTAIGVAGVVFFGVLWAAAGSDLIATHFRLGLESVVLALQITLLLGPPLAFTVTKRVCLGLQARDREAVLHGFETGRIVRLPGGRYVEQHAPLAPARRALLTRLAEASPETLRPTPDGRIRWRSHLRALVSRWFFEDRVLVPVPEPVDEPVAEPVSPAEIAAHERTGTPAGEDGREAVTHAG